VARRYSREALEAVCAAFFDGRVEHDRGDCGIGLVLGGRNVEHAVADYADAIAGLAVAAVILWVGSRLGMRTLDALLDAVPRGLQIQIANAVSGWKECRA